MTEIEQKALKLLNEVNADRGEGRCSDIWRLFPSHEALCRAIEQHEAFKQEVSDAVEEYYSRPYDFPAISQSFIIPKPQPDPLVVLCDHIGLGHTDTEDMANDLRAALEARGLEIREKGQ
jgi:hypothetical protein